jgi:hypothetical protein
MALAVLSIFLSLVFITVLAFMSIFCCGALSLVLFNWEKCRNMAVVAFKGTIYMLGGLIILITLSTMLSSLIPVVRR